MNAEDRAALMRLRATAHKRLAAEFDKASGTAEVPPSRSAQAWVWQANFARDLATHPDLAELNIELDRFYA